YSVLLITSASSILRRRPRPSTLFPYTTLFRSIAALGNMEDADKLGVAISAAFVATLLGIFTGYVLWHPFANKLKRKSKIEIEAKEIMIEGILSILEGEAPRVIEEKLASYLPESERERAFVQKEAAPDG